MKETDDLPTQVCWSCLEELDRCYRFHKTVAEAEKQLLALARLAPRDLKQMNKNQETLQQCDREDGWIGSNDNDESLEATYNTEMRSPQKTGKSQSDSKRHNPDLTTEAFHLATTASGIVQQTTRCSSVADEAKHVRMKMKQL